MAKPKVRKGSTLEQWVVAHANVGRFLFNWAALEQKLADALEIGLKLDPIGVAILVGNTQLRDKLNILKTLAHVYDHAQSREIIKTLDAIGNYSTIRNMMAHDLHGARGDKVQFFRIRAKGRFDMPKTMWSDDDFESAYEKINGLKSALEKGMDVFTSPHQRLKRLASATPSEPTPERLRSRRPQLPLGYPPASRQKGRKPRKPQG